MNRTTLRHAVALGLAAVATAVTLGSVDRLAVRPHDEIALARQMQPAAPQVVVVTGQRATRS